MPRLMIGAVRDTSAPEKLLQVVMLYRSSKRQSITEVSKAAGVSIATVSRVINGHPHVSESTVQAVQAAIKSVGYAPRDTRGRQRGTMGGRTGNIAVLFPDVIQEALRTPLSGRLLHGIGEVLRSHALTMVVTGLPADWSIPVCISQKKVDGLIVRGSRMTVELANLIRIVPCVWVFEAGYQATFDVDMILEDNPAIGSLAANWLIRRGHKHLAVIDPILHHPSFRVRRLFFQDAADQLGTKVTQYVADGDNLTPQLDRMLSSDDRPTGLFIPGTDQHVVDVFRFLSARGLELGRDFDLISCNNDPHRLSALDPRLPNIDIQPEIIGRAAVDMMMWRLQNPKEERRRSLVAPLLVEGTKLEPSARPYSAKSRAV